MREHTFKVLWYTSALTCLSGGAVLTSPGGWDGRLVQYGGMHDVMMEHHSQGRVQLTDLTSKPHFFAVAAPAGLKGEITVFDSDPTVTDLTGKGEIGARDAKDMEATLLVGAYVSSWDERSFAHETSAADFDKTVRDEALQAGLDVTSPFVFTAEGEFNHVRVHVLNGACPMHARMQGVDLPEDQKPFEAELVAIRGRIVGIYAENAVGTLTHPGTSTHVHLLYRDPSSGQMVTAHVEQIGVAKGAVLKLPA